MPMPSGGDAGAALSSPFGVPESGSVMVILPTVRRRSRLARRAAKLTAATMVLAVSAVLLASVVVPRLSGASLYVVEAQSGQPGLRAGTEVVTRPVEASAIRRGDLITFRAGGDDLVIRRVHAVARDQSGQLRFKTQNYDDAVDADDWVLPHQVRGREWYALPYVGHLSAWFEGSGRGIALGLVMLGLLAYAARMFAKAWWEKNTPAE